MKPQILAPLDGSALAEAVVPHATALARLFDQALLLLHTDEQRSVVHSPVP